MSRARKPARLALNAYGHLQDAVAYEETGTWVGISSAHQAGRWFRRALVATVEGCEHTSTTTSDGHGAYCARCGETLA